MDSDDATTWLSNRENQTKLCNKIGPSVIFCTRVHNLIVFNVPLGIAPENQSHQQEVCEANDLEPGTITTMRWAKPIHRRSPEQRTAHLFVTFNNADTANRTITNGIYICNRRCHTERVKREPTRCLKCQGWNHFARECMEEKDRCSNCTLNHRTGDCPTPHCRRCVSCKTDGDHASWSRECPTFIRKLSDFNNRNPENALQYIPTAEPWTWTANTETAHQAQPAPTGRPNTGRECPQFNKKAQFLPRVIDSYIPSYNNNSNSYVPRYDREGKRIQTPTRKDKALPADLMDAHPLTQNYIDAINNENSSGPTHPGPDPIPVADF